MLFTYSRWLELPLATRIKLATFFGVSKKSPTHVFDNKVQSDGYDLKEIEEVLMKIHDMFPSTNMYDSIDQALNYSDNPIVAPKKAGRPRKNATEK